MAFQDYIATEIATDAADGILTRREALRRLVLLGLSAPAAAALLAACGGDGDEDGSPATGGPPADTQTTATTTTVPAGGELITFKGPRVELTGSFAAATTPKGAVLIIHENRGLTPHFVALPGRLAEAGYSALAVDLLSEEGGTATLGDEAKAQAALSAAPRERLVADARAGIDELERRAPGQKLGAMGFCFGGGMTWSVLAAPEPRLAAAVPFYGPLPDGADFAGAKAAVLAIYAELDTRVNASRDAATAALTKAGLTHEVRTFPGVDHAFFNDTGARYNQAAATEAYAAVLDWFGRYLA
ncbi:MAG TPA: dienelactone hydrolase family protein [Acidimicrobiia bacterium]|jgi:carboxymethylenebutenolidase